MDFDDVKEMNAKFDALAVGGKVTMPLNDTFWGARFGMLTDAYNIRWMFNCNLRQSRAAPPPASGHCADEGVQRPPAAGGRRGLWPASRKVITGNQPASVSRQQRLHRARAAQVVLAVVELQQLIQRLEPQAPASALQHQPLPQPARLQQLTGVGRLAHADRSEGRRGPALLVDGHRQPGPCDILVAGPRSHHPQHALPGRSARQRSEGRRGAGAPRAGLLRNQASLACMNSGWAISARVASMMPASKRRPRGSPRANRSTRRAGSWLLP
jgi:hypothetical protein